ncbi:M15 family metallopeptidase [Coleofasciculus sp. LEGE 07092]|uniref:M15 family metallopeptidase n=1 Tax=Coleofasciculus sp. LEGE 07092 TaxID=2777969 RepID=UPI00187FB555|nr:M15 family metallopeptidase [Coleofasciculus sp. LEGE 07092]MBE9152261.1 D-alanyl-D-alanine carboxypeptidase family protein [Coleofasciculus sp. LEGE 07092]
MNNGGIPGKPIKLSEQPGDDIPVAVRDTPDIRRRSRWKPILMGVGLLGLGAIAMGFMLSQPTPAPKTTEESPTPISVDSTTSDNSDASQSETDNILGHLPYEEAPLSELQPITPDGRIKLRTAAAQKFKAMSAAAQAEGILLVPISGFRSVEDQQHLFFDVKAQRGQVTTKRAEVSAPPGYSEHHTGYAIDIGDGRTPATNLSPSFEQTAAFKWLEKNAPRYSFELSFPKDNPQGISYEPWHWCWHPAPAGEASPASA